MSTGAEASMSNVYPMEFEIYYQKKRFNAKGRWEILLNKYYDFPKHNALSAELRILR